MSKPLKIFISYAHTNAAAKDELIKRLAVMKRQGLISIWHDNEILGGDKWPEEIFARNLPNSDIVLYLVSADSLASENCRKELAMASDEKIRVIPIILEDCDWKNDQLSDFQAFPEKGKPINEWRPKSKGWQSVVNGIREVTREMRSQAKLAFDRGNIRVLLGQIDMAIADYSEAIELNPAYAEAYSNRGAAFFKKGEFDTAIADFDTAIRLDSDYVLAYSNRGAAYNEKKEYDKAIADCTKAIQLNPNYAQAYSNRGNAYVGKAEYDRAITDYTKAIHLNPNYANAYNNRGTAYLGKDEYDKAITDFNEALRLKSGFAEAFNNRGAAYGGKGEFNRAITDFNEALRLKPGYVEAYNNRGCGYGFSGEYNLAIVDYTKAIQLKPNYVEAYNNRGTAYLKKGEINKALKNYTKAIQFGSDYPDPHYNRGEAYLHLQEWGRAKEDLITAKQMGMDIVAAFRNDYKNIAAFERRHQVKLPKDIASLVRQPFRSRYPIQERVLDADGKPFESPEVSNLLQKLRNAGPPLSEYLKISPAFGINTGPTEVFVVDQTTRDKLIAEHPSSAEVLKPFLNGEDIRRWQVVPQNQWLIFTYRGIEINAYPAIRKYLETYRDLLSKREGDQEWYALQCSLDEAERLAQPKLVCPHLYDRQAFAVENKGLYCGYTCYVIPTDETWLCGLLNTRVVEWFYAQVSKQLSGAALEAREAYLQQIPVPDIDAAQKDLVRKLVDYLIYLQQQPTVNSKDLAHARDTAMLGYFQWILNGLIYEFYLPDLLQSADRDIFKHLIAEVLPEVGEISGDKMSVFRSLYEHLHHREHPVRVNTFFQDGLRPIRIIEDKW